MVCVFEKVVARNERVVCRERERERVLCCVLVGGDFFLFFFAVFPSILLVDDG